MNQTKTTTEHAMKFHILSSGAKNCFHTMRLLLASGLLFLSLKNINQLTNKRKPTKYLTNALE